MKRLFVIFFFVFLFLSPVFSESREVIVGGFDDYPLIFQNEDEEADGVFADILEIVAEENGWELSYVFLPWSECQEKLLEGEIDLLTTIHFTEDRDQIMDFNKEVVFSTWGKLYADNHLVIENILDVDGLRIGVLAGDNNGLEFEELAGDFAVNIDFIEYPKYSDILPAIEAGEIDGGVLTSAYAYRDNESLSLKYTTPLVFAPKGNYYSVKEGKNADLIFAIDEVLKDLKSKPDSEYYKILDYWVDISANRYHFVPQWLIYTLISSGFIIFLLLFLIFHHRFRLLQEKHELQEQLFQSQKMETIGNFAGGIAHDFNNLLTVILGYSDLLETDLQGLQEEEKKIMLSYSEEIQSAAKRAAFLTGQILTFSRKQVYHPNVINLNDVVRESKKLLSRLLPDNITLSVRLAKGAQAIFADSTQIVQILMNMVVNSRDAMPRGGKIILTTENRKIDRAYTESNPKAKLGEFIRLNITDEGEGMDEETLERIFEPFFTTKEAGKGTGLGLSVVHGILTRAEGWPEVESRPGAGSSFSLYFPKVQNEKLAENSAQGKKISINGEKRKILLIEDDPSVLDYTSKMLKKLGFLVDASSSVKSAAEYWNSAYSSYDLILSDIILSDGSGTDFIETLLPDHPDLKVLFYSAYADLDIRRDFIEKNGFLFLEKPFSKEELIRALKKLLSEDEPS